MCSQPTCVHSPCMLTPLANTTSPCWNLSFLQSISIVLNNFLLRATSVRPSRSKYINFIWIIIAICRVKYLKVKNSLTYTGTMSKILKRIVECQKLHVFQEIHTTHEPSFPDKKKK